MKKLAFLLAASSLFAFTFCSPTPEVVPTLPPTCADTLDVQPLAGWSTQTFVVPEGAKSVWFLDEKNGMLHVNYEIRKTSDGGFSWQLVPATSRPFWQFDFFFADDLGFLALAKSGASTASKNGDWLCRFETASQTWTETPLPDQPKMIHFLSQNEGFALFPNIDTAFQKTSDGGQTWSAVAGFETKKLALAHFRGPLGWAHCPPFELFLTDDYGKTWRLSAQAPAIEGRFDRPDAQTIFFVPELGDRLVGSFDGGASWEGLALENVGAWHFFDRERGAAFLTSIAAGQFSFGFQNCVRFAETTDGGRTWQASKGWNSERGALLPVPSGAFFSMKKSLQFTSATGATREQNELVWFKKQ